MLVSDAQLGDGMIITAAFLGGAFFGVFVWMWLASRDEQIVRLGEDEVIIKKPHESMVLVQVTPDVARRLVYNSETNENAWPEARKMYRGAKPFGKA